MKKKDLYPFVEIIWDDAASNINAWVSPKDIATLERIISRGWVVREDDNHVVVAASICHNATIEDDVSNVTAIPKGMIVERNNVRITKVKVVPA